MNVNDLADQYNRSGKIPPEKTPKTRADGWKQTKDTPLFEPYKEFEMPQSRQ